jgi:hypothetical protein
VFYNKRQVWRFSILTGGFIMNLVRVRRAKGLPFAPATFYKWHHTRKYPEIFIKVGGSLFVDLDRLEKILEAGRGRGGK